MITKTKINNKIRYIIKCKECNNEFITKRKDAKFCCRSCHSKYRYKDSRVEVNCSFCNKANSIKKSLYLNNKKHFCNQKCRTEYLRISMKGEGNPNYNRIEYRCDGCGTSFNEIPSKIKKQKYIFCSNDCYKKNIGKFISGSNNPCYKHKVIKFCTSCGKSITRKSSQFRSDIQFCCNQCRAKYIGSLKIKRVEVVCDYCGEVFTRQPSQFNGKHYKFCSIECKNKGDSKYFSGENSHAYNHSKPLEDRFNERKYIGYYEWRKAVYERDNYTCQCCNDDVGGNLVAHHLLNYSEHIELRTDVNNGITMCKNCHNNFHKIYGYKNNSINQLEKFIKE